MHCGNTNALGMAHLAIADVTTWTGAEAHCEIALQWTIVSHETLSFCVGENLHTVFTDLILQKASDDITSIFTIRMISSLENRRRTE
jgi:hypothetical protein